MSRIRSSLFAFRSATAASRSRISSFAWFSDSSSVEMFACMSTTVPELSFTSVVCSSFIFWMRVRRRLFCFCSSALSCWMTSTERRRSSASLSCADRWWLSSFIERMISCVDVSACSNACCSRAAISSCLRSGLCTWCWWRSASSSAFVRASISSSSCRRVSLFASSTCSVRMSSASWFSQLLLLDSRDLIFCVAAMNLPCQYCPSCDSGLRSPVAGGEPTETKLASCCAAAGVRAGVCAASPGPPGPSKAFISSTSLLYTSANCAMRASPFDASTNSLPIFCRNTPPMCCRNFTFFRRASFSDTRSSFTPAVTDMGGARGCDAGQEGGALMGTTGPPPSLCKSFSGTCVLLLLGGCVLHGDTGEACVCARACTLLLLLRLLLLPLPKTLQGKKCLLQFLRIYYISSVACHVDCHMSTKAHQH
eukprot:Rhum_TRINITY_DN13178_c0_g1::Rhum_TRINITY_DN13178_c0_g1_i1::g.57605::m.57605